MSPTRRSVLAATGASVSGFAGCLGGAQIPFAREPTVRIRVRNRDDARHRVRVTVARKSSGETVLDETLTVRAGQDGETKELNVFESAEGVNVILDENGQVEILQGGNG